MVDSMVRAEVRGLKNYGGDSVPCRIKMDANENGWGLPGEIVRAIQEDISTFPFNRYPDPDSRVLRERLSLYTGVGPGELMVGNGSDELIRYIVDTFVDKGDRVITPMPTFPCTVFLQSWRGERA